MQKGRSRDADATIRAFGRRVRAARTDADMPQAKLQQLLAQRGVKIDSSGITRIEAGEREPRLYEALTLADLLGFAISDAATPAAEIATSMSEVRRLTKESREALLHLLESIDQAAERVSKRD
jgi:ribosome-binding protein aMBF1 (putative translation factor)